MDNDGEFTMKPRILLAMFTLALMASGSSGQDDQGKKDRQNLQGTWKVVGAEKMGEAAPREEIQELELIFMEEMIRVRDGGKLQQKFKFKLDAAKDPRWLDLTYVGGPNNGRTDRAIYKLDGNNLKICIQQFQDEGRPKAFATEKKSGTWLVVMERFK
jgi:uncharacterized protein (TIGR03067 family)